jgi:hypothetical protein
MFNTKPKFVFSALFVSAIAVGNSAFAAASEAFTSSITTVSADIATYGGALIGVAAVGVGFMVGMKYIKKIRGAA